MAENFLIIRLHAKNPSVFVARPFRAKGNSPDHAIFKELTYVKITQSRHDACSRRRPHDGNCANRCIGNMRTNFAQQLWRLLSQAKEGQEG
jgi:hypothetical protein